ncbi:MULTISPECIES: cellulase family glycosylhydrolase [unclassified Pseudomonas]|uniref:cellulase family glycosylhydrolase n=1 Tax=unclassified Pseudomonas TaxID=196821 RepID=UPI002AC8E1C4|nr:MULTISPECIES: cellulase family glycosylhydrolase [unclassified Pseudomonas]MEB0042409.1 cellulase family glycosylhydrolase [Pseudomonas sp. MH10]MEB0079170.1 cellulase family glycosylhydrolase [Pseudomonas sp. MH10out]MEB0092386.1 cellulase family glycosylhydrolase [Pseudomonas sp. CCI4.2]MEB0102115.1 cellulase family glycosylhydrolase [Pseudomonas sp. CCI3.2]MEB0122100.1 cellulase family glycosylhydrolase [Pseudomonas sp. CCI1.2]
MGVFLSFSAMADEPFIIGVSTQLLNKKGSLTQVMQLIADAGITSVRDDALWSTVEPRRGQLHIDSVWLNYLSETKARRISPLLVLGYGNPSYDDNSKPRDPQIRRAFTNYAKFVSHRLGNSAGYYEIWNEWDGEKSGDAALSTDYAVLVTETAQRIRSQNKQVKILAGAVTSKGIDMGFADRLIEADVLSKVDGLSLHPSVYCRNAERHTPEHWIAWLRDVDANLKSIANKPVPLYLTEMGWPSNNGKCGVDERTQAAYLARSFFLGRTLPDIKGMWWYDLINEGTDRNEIKQNFGLLEQNLRPKPAYQTLKAISPTVREFHYEAEKSRETDTHYLLRFSKGSEQILVAWSISGGQMAHVEASSLQHGNVQLIDTAEPEKGRVDSGSPWKCDDSRCSAEIPINEFPKIISLGTRPPLFAQ